MMLASRRKPTSHYHDAARPASPDWRRPLRPEPRIPTLAARTVRQLLTTAADASGSVRSHHPRQRRGQPVQPAAVRERWERHGDVSEKSAALVSQAPWDFRRLGRHAVGRGWSALPPGRRRDRTDGEDVGISLRASTTTKRTRSLLCEAPHAGPGRGARRGQCLRYFQQFSHGRGEGPEGTDMASNDQRLPVREKVGYAMGDIATNFFFQSMNPLPNRFSTPRHQLGSRRWPWQPCS